MGVVWFLAGVAAPLAGSDSVRRLTRPNLLLRNHTDSRIGATRVGMAPG